MAEQLDAAKGRDPIVLGGREFRVIDFDRRTVAADHYMAKLVRQCGADKAMPVEGEQDAVYLVRMQSLLIDSGKTPEIIAGLLLPLGMDEADWTPGTANRTAQFIAKLNTQEDREKVMDLALEVVFGFFRQGLEQLARSLTFIRKAEVEQSGDASPMQH